MAISEAIDRTPPSVALHIGGKEFPSGSAGIYRHVNAASGQVQAEIPLAGAPEIDAAVKAAAEAFRSWKAWKAEDRRVVLSRLGELVVQNAEEFARRGSLDNGTPIAVTRRAPLRAAEWIQYYAGWIGKNEGRVTSAYRTAEPFSYTLAEPYGVIGAIITWNGPLTSLGMKVGPALAAGNTVVVKASEMTPFAPDLFARLVKQAGIPDGVVNVLVGDAAAGRALVVNPKVQKITFTGGPVTARRILADCAEQFKPAILELGGKSANLVFPDADLDVVCGYGLQNSIVSMSGQGCAYPTRMLVHRDIYRKVCGRMVEEARGIRVGDPFDPATQSGPVVNEAAVDRILGMIGRARADETGKILIGGSRLGGSLARGYFIEPTIFADVDPASELAQHEVFGPVLAIMPFESEAEAISIANSTSYGLSAYIQTNDVKRVHRISGQLQAGAILVNGCSNIQASRPFGGLGLSGYGREGGREGLEEFQRVKSVAIA